MPGHEGLIALFARFPLSLIDHDNVAFYAGLRDRQLVVNRCRACGTWQFPPRSMCAECWSTAMAHDAVSGLGSVFLTTVLRPVELAGAVVALVTVDLDEQQGLRISASMINCAVDTVRIGMLVELAWPEHVAFAFQPRAAPAHSSS